MKVKQFKYWILAADLAWIPVALGVSFSLRHGPIHWQLFWGTYLPYLLGVGSLWAVLFSAMKLDGFRQGWFMPAVASQLILSVAVLVLLLLAIDDLARFYLSRLQLAYFGILLFVGFLLLRRGIRAVLQSRYLEGAVRRVVILGNGRVAREIAAKFKRHPEMMRQVCGFLCAEDGLPELVSGSNTEFESISTLKIIDLLRDQTVDELIIALSRMDSDVLSLAARCRIEGIRVSVVPYPYELYLSKPELVDVGGLPVLQLRRASAAYADSIWKRGLDMGIGAVLAVLSLPLILAGSFALRHRPGGGMSSELRCGRTGRPFRMFRLNSERDRPGMPRIELMLQQLSITELPQIWNVLRGEMSLVGPRPESPERVKHYSDWHRQRLNVKPGMTGMAQVHGLREQHSSEEKTRYDLQYMLNSSPFLDSSLLMQTAWTLVGRLIRIPGQKSVAEWAPEIVFAKQVEVPITNANRPQSSTN